MGVRFISEGRPRWGEKPGPVTEVCWSGTEVRVPLVVERPDVDISQCQLHLNRPTQRSRLAAAPAFSATIGKTHNTTSMTTGRTFSSLGAWSVRPAVYFTGLLSVFLLLSMSADVQVGGWVKSLVLEQVSFSGK